MKILEIKNITKNFNPVTAVDDFSLSVNNGDLLAILGPRGCGESTLLSCIAGHQRADEGEIDLNERCLYSENRGISIPPEERNIGFIFQNYALWPHMKVEKNISYPLRMQRGKLTYIRENVNRILNILRLEGRGIRYPEQLSGGEQQRVALGRALIMDSNLLLLDEPLSNLDALLREEMQREIRNIHRELKLTVIHVTHDQSEAMAMSDRIVVMNYGKPIQTGKPRDIYESPETILTADFIGINNIIHGKIIKIKDALFFDSETGIKLKLSEPYMEESDSAIIAIRPEDVLIDEKTVSEKSLQEQELLPIKYTKGHIFFTRSVQGNLLLESRDIHLMDLKQ